MTRMKGSDDGDGFGAFGSFYRSIDGWGNLQISIKNEGAQVGKQIPRDDESLMTFKVLLLSNERDFAKNGFCFVLFKTRNHDPRALGGLVGDCREREGP
jgi:hypothetical protein